MKDEACGNAAGIRCVVTVYLAPAGEARIARRTWMSEGRSGRSEIFDTCSFAREATRGLGIV